MKENRRKFYEFLSSLIGRPVMPPIDNKNVQLVSGKEVPKDRSHTKLKKNGQQEDYVVLSPEELAKGFVRPIRNAYVHKGKIVDGQRQGGCGTVTVMSRKLAETYAANPKFYSGTYCIGCGTHLPLNEFVWDKVNPEEELGT